MPTLLETLGIAALFERSRDVLVVIDAQTDEVLAANRVASELLEYPPQDLLSLGFQELFAEEARAAAREARGQFAAPGGAPPHLPAALMRADGTSFPCEWFGWPAQAEDRRDVLVLSFRDLSEQRRAIEEIHLRNVAIASVSSGVTIADARLPDLPLIYVNEGFERITGYKAREAVGRSCRFLQGTDRDQPGLDILRRALREGEACEVRLRNHRKDGERFWNELHISPVRDEHGELTHFVGIQIDVTDRVESRLRLEESEERYRTLAESIEDLIARTATDGTIQFLSPSFRRHTGWDASEWVGRSFLELVHPDDREGFAETLAAVGGEALSRRHSFRLQARDGTTVWMEATSTLVVEHDRPTRVVSVIRDITLRRKAEDDIRVALEREKELNLIKTGFIRMVSHEFRTPMTGIGASTAFLSQYGEKLPAEKRERHFRNIERSLARMNQLLDDVLFVSRSESGRVPFKTEPVDLASFSEQLVDEMLGAHPERRIDLATELPPDPVFELDPNLLHHVIQNLLGNALKYSAPDSPVAMVVRHEAAGDTLTWTVSDRGIGIPEADQVHLFEPFRRAGNVSTVRGTGLGLYIAKRSAELHGGTISFSSSIGVGSHFTLHLPAHRPSSSPSPSTHA